MEEDHPVYSGSRYTPGRAPHATPPGMSAATSQALTTGSADVHDTAASFEEAAIDRAEYTLDQQRQQKTQNLIGDIEAENLRRLSLPDGAPDAFWDANGIFREADYKAYKAQMLSSFNGLDKGYIRPKSVARAREATLQIQFRLRNNLDLKMAASLTPRAKKATLANAESRAKRGDYIGAMATISGAPDYALTQQEKDDLCHNYNQAALLSSAQRAYDSGAPDAWLDTITAPGFMESLTPDNKRRVLRMSKSLVVPSSGISTGKSQGNGKSSRSKKTGPELPMGLPSYVVQVYENSNGDLSDGPDARRAREAIKRMAFDTITLDNHEIETDNILLAANYLGIDKTEARRYCEQALNQLKGAGKFNINDFCKNLSVNNLMRESNVRKIERLKTRQLELARIQGQKRKGKEKDAYNEEKSDINAQVKYWKAQQAAIKSAADSSIRSQYADWLSNHPDARVSECTMAAYNIVEKIQRAGDPSDPILRGGIGKSILSSEAFNRVQSLRAAEKQVNQAAQARREQTEQDIKKTDDARIAAMNARKEAESEQQFQQAIYESDPERALTRYSQARLDTTLHSAADLPNSNRDAYIAVPSNSPMSGQTLSVRYGNRELSLPCRPGNVSNPTLSALAQLKAGLLDNVNATRIIYNGAGRAIINEASQPPNAKMYQYMIESEARIDKNGNIQIYHPPAGDGGGEYEVAGINATYHPEEAKRLRHMIDSGADQEEIREEIGRYYQDFTQPTADHLEDAEIQSEGVEYFLRDTALNMGNSGAERVLRAALGIPGGESISQALRGWRGDFGTLLQRLASARQARYDYLSRNKAGKAQFARGWANRNRIAYTNALNLL